MSLPTEPGFYWCKFAPDAGWTVAEVWCADRKERWVATCNAWEALTQNVAEWGERIPDNDRLKALKYLAYADPTVSGMCVFCGFCQRHAPDCPWKRAQEKREGASDDTR